MSSHRGKSQKDSSGETGRNGWSVRARFAAWMCLFQVVLVPSMHECQAQSPSEAAASAQRPPASEANWTRTFRSGPDTFLIYEPQIETWEGNLIHLYAAVEFQTDTDGASNYGVVWFSARTEVDKVNRLVTLEQAQVTKVKFPVAHDKESRLTELLNKTLPGATKTVSLDRMETALVAAGERVKTVEVKNDPPEVIVANNPSLLVLIDGAPQLREVPKTKLQGVINTKAILLFDNEKNTYYLRVKDWWLEAPKLEGQWTYARTLSDDMRNAEEYITSHTPNQAVEGQDAKSAPKQPGQKAETPHVYVGFSPTELIETKGEPKFKSIPETRLEYAENTNGNLFRLEGVYYVLISGRWFKGGSLRGPWTFVNGNELPPDFARIPADNPKATVLASVPRTPASEEALIANSIPQTATITRSEAKLTVQYDGKAAFAPIEGTTMEYANDTSAAVIKVSEANYYSVEAGVWFKASTPEGPWVIAESVPAEIYTIPASSPLHYVTYVKVYGSTPEVVYVGYTPGYYGTVVSESTTTVVYGTGWYYPPYIGPTAWYGYPYTYGVGAAFTYTSSTGWSFGFGYGYAYYPYYYPWWGPMGYYGYGWYPYYGWGAWGGAAAANVYGVWGNTAYSRTGAAWANPYTGNYGAATRGGYYNTQTGRSTVAGRGYNTNIYTGNTGGYRGAATYNPNTGIVAGGGAGYLGNVYTGEGAAGRGGFAYNTNTGAGIAGGKDNIYAGKDGTVYRYNRQSGNWSSNTGNGWQPATKPDTSLQRQQQMRTQGTQRTNNYNSMRNYGGMRGARMGGGRRR
ncbi:MAG: TonB-dependent receptor [Acidobacteriaceae bacterium]|nr:TonB-dependent receptor [Acidobacteriaceae bacterium]